MEALQLLDRNEMKKVMGGDPACAGDCNALYGGYYNECGGTYGPDTDEWSQCVDEVHDLNTACINRCFQVQ
ncbi:MAG: hypothetical protein WD053_07460 [Gracilimonas sp.]